MNYTVHDIYGDAYSRTGHFGYTYRGVNCVKCPFDYALYQMLITEVKPDLIIEIGTHVEIGRASCRERVCQYV